MQMWGEHPKLRIEPGVMELWVGKATCYTTSCWSWLNTKKWGKSIIYFCSIFVTLVNYGPESRSLEKTGPDMYTIIITHELTSMSGICSPLHPWSHGMFQSPFLASSCWWTVPHSHAVAARCLHAHQQAQPPASQWLSPSSEAQYHANALHHSGSSPGLVSVSRNTDQWHIWKIRNGPVMGKVDGLMKDLISKKSEIGSV